MTKKRQQWEYVTVNVKDGISSDLLNSWGKDGWEFCSYFMAKADEEVHHVAIFKRPL